MTQLTEQDRAAIKHVLSMESLFANPIQSPVERAYRAGKLAAIEECAKLREALQILHDETVDYVRINNLGDPWHNRSMQMARDALASAKAEAKT